MRLRKVGGSYIEFFPGDFGRYHRYDFTVGFTLDVPELQNEPSIAIFPNPGAGLTTVELNGQINGQARLQLVDLTGRILYQENMKATADFAESFINMSGYPSGTYLFQIDTPQGTYTQKYIRQ
jgi:hypothetical protein